MEPYYYIKLGYNARRLFLFWQRVDYWVDDLVVDSGMTACLIVTATQWLKRLGVASCHGQEVS